MKNKIVISLISEEQEFQRTQATAARAVAQGQIEIEVHFADANAVLQIQQLFRHIHAPEDERPVVIAVDPISADSVKRVAKAAVAAGIGWILLRDHDPYLLDLAQLAPTLPIGAISSDDEEIGRIQARQIAALLPKGGAILYIEGPAQHAATTARRRALETEMPSSGVHIEKTLVGDWSEASAEKAMRSWFRLKTSEAVHVDLIAAQNDHMAMGVRKALTTERPEWLALPLIGCDGLPDGGQRAVRDGQLTATVVQALPASTAVDLVLKAQRGERFPPRVVLPPTSFPTLEQLRRR